MVNFSVLFKTMRLIIGALCMLLLKTESYADPAQSSVAEELGLVLGAIPMREQPNWRAPKTILVNYNPVVSFDDLSSTLEGVEIIAVRDWSNATREIKQADAIIGMCAEDVIQQAENLQWLQITSAGVEKCFTSPSVRDGDFVISNMQKVSSSPIGEHVMGLILSFSRNLPRHARAQNEGRWDQPPLGSSGMWEIKGKTILIVGLGGIGQQVALRAKAFGMNVTATRNSSRDGPDYVDYVGLSDELLSLAADADVVVNATPLTKATTGLFDATFFEAMKESALFINVGRGQSVVTDDLVTALNDGHIAGAGLDVTEPEPLPDGHPLWTAKNVIITPHVAPRSNMTLERYKAVLRENIIRFAAGDALYSIVERDRQY